MKLFLIFLCVISLSALVACNKGKAAPGGPPKGPTGPVPVKIAQAMSQQVPVQINTFGTVGSFSSIAVKTQVAGILTKVHFDRGQDLRKGQVLYNIDPRPFQAVLAQARAVKAKNEVLLANLQRNLRHVQQLRKDGAATADEVDQASTLVDAQVAAIAADQAAIDKAQIDLDNCTITCPIDGKAGELLVTEGNFVKANDVTLVIINQIKPIQLFFSIPQADLPTVKQYMGAGTLTVEAFPPDKPQEVEKGDLFFVDNAIDSTAGTIRLGARFANVGERLWPGQYMLVTLRLAIREAVLAPSRAVSAGRDGKYVFVIGPDKTAKTRLVTTGPIVGDLVVIEKGLAAGEMVVTDGQLRLKDGDKTQGPGDKPASAPESAPATRGEGKP